MLWEKQQVILINSQGKYLLHQRDDDPTIFRPSHWTLIGGAVEKGETPEQAAVRETKEEIGYDLRDFKPLKICRWGDIDYYIFVSKFEGNIKGLILTEGQGMGFFSYEELNHLNIVEYAKIAITEHHIGLYNLQNK